MNIWYFDVISDIMYLYQKWYQTSLILPDSFLFVPRCIFLQRPLSNHRAPILVENNILRVICTNSNFDWLWSVIKCPETKNTKVSIQRIDEPSKFASSAKYKKMKYEMFEERFSIVNWFLFHHYTSWFRLWHIRDGVF